MLMINKYVKLQVNSSIYNINPKQHRDETMMKQFYGNLAIKIIDLRCSSACDNDLLFVPADGVSNIEQLLLWNNRITWKGMQTISLCKWDRLILIDVDNNKIGNEGVKYLSRMKSPQLKKLNLCTNEIGKEGVIHLTKSNWPTLETVYLNENKIGFDSIKYLNKNHWKDIKNIHLNSTCITLQEAKGLVLCHWSLQNIDIGNNLIISTQQKKLKNIIKRRIRKIMFKT